MANLSKVRSASEEDLRPEKAEGEAGTIEPVKPLTLRQKLADIRRDVHNVEKRGRNDFHKYSYAQASDVAGILGTALAEHNIILSRRNLKIIRAQSEKENVVDVELEYGFLDADSDEEIWMPAFGTGYDRADKAGPKAWTSALKYFLIQAFLLATGDDPEATGDKDHEVSPPAPKGKLELKPDAKPEPPKPATADQIKELLQLCEDTQTEPDKVPTAFNDSWDTLTVQTYEKAKAILLKRVQKRAEAAANS
jgi:hypothetical protein